MGALPMPCGHFSLLLHSLAWHFCSGRLQNWWILPKYSSTCLFTLWQQPGGGELFSYFFSLVGIFISIFCKWDTNSESIFLSLQQHLCETTEGARLADEFNFPRNRRQIAFPGQYTGFCKTLLTDANQWLPQSPKGEIPMWSSAYTEQSQQV